MQKKSLLVALFCGALCLTGCLKNEESASVSQVRIAKANELNSLASLNEAKAQAELIYAKAQETVSKAEAGLIEAQAALTSAQAQTELVRAQLLEVQVKLAEVKVDEEKVKLQMMEADLTARLAGLEVEIAAAEAAKQAWANLLADLKAKAEIKAIENAQSLIEAEAELEEAVLKLAGERADSAKYYADLYFATLEEVEAYQLQELQYKAQQVLMNQAAILTRDALHEQINENNKEIAQNEAIIAALQAKQTMDPEEAEAALKEAREALEVAYTAYRAALEAKSDAKEVSDDLNDKVSDFTKGWDSWVWDLREKVNGIRRASFVQSFEEVEIEGQTFIVPTVGMRTRTAEGVEFLPLFNDEVSDTTNTRYPDVTVYDKNHRDHEHIRNIVIAPASINYDNIKTALDTAVAREEAAAERRVARRAARNEWIAENVQEQIEKWEDTLEMHKTYVNARKDTVSKYEQAYIDALEESKASFEAVPAAWTAFQDYMLGKYPTVTANVFIRRFNADTNYIGRLADSTEFAEALETIEGQKDSSALKQAIKDAFEAYAAAMGVYNRALDSMNTYGTAAYEAKQAFLAALVVWNSNFADLVTAYGGYEAVIANPNILHRDGNHWSIYDKTKDEYIGAGETQDSTMNALTFAKMAKEQQYFWFINDLADIKMGGEDPAEQLEMWNEKVEQAEALIVRAKELEDAAWNKYVEAYDALSEAIGMMPTEMTKDYNPDFNIFDVVTFPTEAQPYAKYYVNSYYLTEDNEWDMDKLEGIDDPFIKVVEKKKDLPFVVLEPVSNGGPSTTQLAVLNAVKEFFDFRCAVNDAKRDFEFAAEACVIAHEELNNADAALIAALGGNPEEDDIADFLDEEAEALYADYAAAKENITLPIKAFMQLMAAYRSYPDFYGRPSMSGFAQYRTHNIGWLVSSYNVDYKATYIGMDGEEHSIATLLNGGQRRGRYNKSLSYKVEQANKFIEETLPEQLEKYAEKQQEEVDEFKEEVEKILATVNAYASLQDDYNNWVEDRMDAYKAYNQAKMDAFDANVEYVAAKADYEAAKAVVDEGTWVYDPEHKIEIEGVHHNREGFIKVPIAEEIARLEEENEEIEKENEFLRNVLTDGKTVVGVLNEIYDEKIASISEKVAIMTTIAENYKEIMNEYLGVNDDEE